MGSLNTGQVVENIPEELWEKAALDFSEGNEELRELLLYCFQNGIQTRGCCAGHEREDGERTMPYIGFNFNEQNKEAIINMLKNLMSEKGLVFSFAANPGQIQSYFSISFVNKQPAFDKVLKACKSEVKSHWFNGKKLDPVMKKVLSTIDNHYQENDYMMIQYNTDSSKYSFETNIDDAYEAYKDGGNIPNEIREGYAVVDNIKDWQMDEILKHREKNKDVKINTDICRGLGRVDGRNDYIRLEACLGISLEKFAEEIVRLNAAGQKIIATFNGFSIDSVKFASAEDIVNAYEKAREEARVGKLMREITGGATPEDYEEAARKADEKPIVRLDKGREMEGKGK